MVYLSAGDPFADRALEILDTEEELTIHALNLAEVLAHPARDGQEEQLVEHLELIGLAVAPQHPTESLELAKLRAATRLRMPDCCPLLLAERLDATLATFDDQLTAAARDRGVQVVGLADAN